MNQKFDSKTNTRSLARILADESVKDINQMKEIRNAAYKTGFAQAASILRNHIRQTIREGRELNLSELMVWTEECQHWRRNNSLKDMPELR